jgi:hypothetical protein
VRGSLRRERGSGLLGLVIKDQMQRIELLDRIQDCGGVAGANSEIVRSPSSENTAKRVSRSVGGSQNSLTTRLPALLEDLPQVKGGTSHSRSEALFDLSGERVARQRTLTR